MKTKKNTAGVPNKPGNWKSLGVRPKFDPKTQEATTPDVWNDKSCYIQLPEPLMIQEVSTDAGSEGRKRIGRPPGSGKKKNARYALDWLDDADVTNAPAFSPAYRSQTEPLYNRYSTITTPNNRPYKSAYNILGEVQSVMEGTLINIRTEVMEQCNWSMATYYRKQQPEARLSFAEADMIGALVRRNMDALNVNIIEIVSKCMPQKNDQTGE